jgi:hypothetical protein
MCDLCPVASWLPAGCARGADHMAEPPSCRASVRSSSVPAGEFSRDSVLPDPGERGVPAGGGSVVRLPYLGQESRSGCVQPGQQSVDRGSGGGRGLADLGLRRGVVPLGPPCERNAEDSDLVMQDGHGVGHHLRLGAR